jgi:dTDP-4-amino-4,6-dideoxygalactose transaminase
MITLRNSRLSEVIKSLRNHGSKGSYLHDSIGFNSRLDELQAGILLVKLKRVDEYNRKRREKALRYNNLLAGIVTCPSEKEHVSHVYNQYTILCKDRNEVQQKLKDNGISSVVYYPRPLHLQDAMSYLGYREGAFPIAEKASREVLSLPMYAELEESDIEKIAGVIKKVVH